MSKDEALLQIAADHALEVEKVLSGHYTAQKTPAECIASLTADAIAKAGAVQSDADRIVAFLSAIEVCEIITADGGDRDVDPDGYGFSTEMLKLIEAIAEDEDDVWNEEARRVLAEGQSDGKARPAEDAGESESESEGQRDAGDDAGRS